ncbi:DNA methyltransferase [Novosphingobium sp. NDB2Meth1]|uniref:DNA methyltransferase n=1 Tax=Novosphingobium sp. NDB2Meth1 TaxID=1892847 RepID=UPI000931443C|nr:DNA methyltransferase [Novosphingobium sp. NDB2Meth1]
MTNTLYYGDNLHVLREHVKDESVDLIYLDPPFNSNANYNILFKSPEGHNADAQIEAFEDTWHWNEKAEDAFDEVMRSGNTAAFELLRAMRAFLGANDMMAYLAMMAVRLLELHRVLKPTGSLYLHCDPTASHYLKLLLDGVFGAKYYRNEIIWKRTSAHGDASVGFGDVTDAIFYYSKSEKTIWNRQFSPLTDKHVSEKYGNVDAEGRRYTTRDLRSPSPRPNLTYEYKGYKPHPNGWSISRELMERYDAEGLLYFPSKADGRIRLKIFLDERQGRPLQNLWDDIPPINSRAQERLGYPTQKPLALLERIIAASSNEGDVVLDPFCGCGTAVHAAQKMGRQWLGIDVTHLAISLIEKRMKDAFPGLAFHVEGRPQDLQSALDLAERDKYQFQWWAVSLVDALPFGGKKKGADGGIDGYIYFKPDGKRTEKAIVSVKGGRNVDVKMIRDLHSAMEREKAPFGVFICVGLPTGPMEREAAAVGVWENEYTGRKHPRLQILTLAELFRGKRPDIPWVDASVLKSAKREDTGRQGSLL